MKRQRAKSQTISPTTNDEPPPKKVVKKIKPPVGPTSLGSLPLFGERVPQNGYTDVPSLAQTTCDEIRAVINHVNELKQTPESSKVSPCRRCHKLMHGRKLIVSVSVTNS